MTVQISTAGIDAARSLVHTAQRYTASITDRALPGPVILRILLGTYPQIPSCIDLQPVAADRSPCQTGIRFTVQATLLLHAAVLLTALLLCGAQTAVATMLTSDFSG